MNGLLEPLVYCIVLSWNNFDDTDECLESLSHLTHRNHRVVVVDNGSTDGSRERLKERWADRAMFVENAANLGVAGGFNAGCVRALADGADYVLLLNNDITVAHDLIERLLPAFATPDTAAVSPVITFFEPDDLVWYAGGFYSDRFGYMRHLSLGARIEALGLHQGTVLGNRHDTDLRRADQPQVPRNRGPVRRAVVCHPR